MLFSSNSTSVRVDLPLLNPSWDSGRCSSIVCLILSMISFVNTLNGLFSKAIPLYLFVSFGSPFPLYSTFIIDCLHCSEIVATSKHLFYSFVQVISYVRDTT